MQSFPTLKSAIGVQTIGPLSAYIPSRALKADAGAGFMTMCIWVLLDSRNSLTSV